MKIIWMVYPYGPVYGEKGKPCRYTQFGNELANNGYFVVWWTSNFSHGEKVYRCEGWKDIFVSKNFVTKLVPTKAYKKNISLKRIAFEKAFSYNLNIAFLKDEKPDLIITAGTGMFNAFYPCWSYAKKNHIPIIYDIMDISLFETYMSEHYKLLAPIAKAVMQYERKREEGFFKGISGICGLGKNQLEYAKRRAFNRNIPTCLVYNGIEVKKLRSMKDTDEWKKFVPKKDPGWRWCIFAGSLGPSYDIATIVKCAKLCKEKILFLVAGSGPQAELVKNASKTCANIVFLGQVELNTLFSIYRQCDIGLCAFSSYSTVDMPDKFYDYCAAGLATVNSLGGEVKEWIEKKELGIQYLAGDADSMYKSISELCNSDRLDKYKQNAYKIGEQFDIVNQMKKLSCMVEKILR